MTSGGKQPHFVFIWVPSRDENKEQQNELLRNIRTYESAVALFNKHSTVQADFCIAMNLSNIASYLKQHCSSNNTNGAHSRYPVFILLGHGKPTNGEMHLWDGEWLNPNNLLRAWNPAFVANPLLPMQCDLIATQCGANLFVCPMQWPILLNYSRHIRFLAAAKPNADKSYWANVSNEETLHVELTTLMIYYLRVADNGCDQKWLKKCMGWLERVQIPKQLPPPPQQPPPPTVVQPPPVRQQQRIIIEPDREPDVVNQPTPPPPSLLRKLLTMLKTLLLFIFVAFLWLILVPTPNTHKTLSTHSCLFITVLITGLLYRLFRRLLANM